MINRKTEDKLVKSFKFNSKEFKKSNIDFNWDYFTIEHSLEPYTEDLYIEVINFYKKEYSETEKEYLSRLENLLVSYNNEKFLIEKTINYLKNK